MENLIHSGDHWILLISIMSIGLLMLPKTRVFGLFGAIITTIYIDRNYNSYRAILHVVLTFLCVYILRIALQKYALSTVDNKKNNLQQ